MGEGGEGKKWINLSRERRYDIRVEGHFIDQDMRGKTKLGVTMHSKNIWM